MMKVQLICAVLAALLFAGPIEEAEKMFKLTGNVITVKSKGIVPVGIRCALMLRGTYDEEANFVATDSEVVVGTIKSKIIQLGGSEYKVAAAYVTKQSYYGTVLYYVCTNGTVIELFDMKSIWVKDSRERGMTRLNVHKSYKYSDKDRKTDRYLVRFVGTEGN